jgi:hypothetical protein
MIFNLFLPLISFFVCYGSFNYENPLFSIVFVLTSISMSLYLLAVSYEVAFNSKSLKDAYSSLPLKTLETHWLRRFLSYSVIYLPVLGILYLTCINEKINYTVWWTFNLFMLIFFMYRLKNIKNNLINEKTRKTNEEK